MGLPAIEITAVDRRPASPQRALWHGPWGTLLLVGHARWLTAAVFQGPPPGRPGTAHPLPAPWGGRRRLRLALHGTAFQMQVWRALAELRAGEPVSYSELAARIGRPGAARAVASAVAANPVPVLLPCHRVIRRNGQIGQYIGGASRKRDLLAHERIDRSNPHVRERP
ncbi:hypothetical protein BBH56_03645 [Spiribacter roseus]|uniref:methylated-DNA--[protein]-cysteine S-methyltransferase n=1 Tax=Spiribacter roseus TaxID=1855875 RepID=UPI000F70F114|nr:hypothetical protein BBH56_03645 [Spiribacter roseus]